MSEKVNYVESTSQSEQRIASALVSCCFYFFFFASELAHADYREVKTLSLNEAIMLAMRENPAVQTSQLNHVMQKFSVDVQRWQFEPHLTLQASRNITRTVTAGSGQSIQSWAVQPNVTWQTPIGTQLTLMETNNISPGSHYNPGLSLQIIQPLIRGFGKAVVEAALEDAVDSEQISRLNVLGAMQSTITAVINAYLDVVSAAHTVQVDQDALTRAKTSVQQTQFFIKAGRKAGVELVTVQADVANAEARLENDSQTISYAYLIGADGAMHHTANLINKSSNDTKIEYNPITSPDHKYHGSFYIVIEREDGKDLTITQEDYHIMAMEKDNEEKNAFTPLCFLSFDASSYKKHQKKSIKCNFSGELPESLYHLIKKNDSTATDAALKFINGPVTKYFEKNNLDNGTLKLSIVKNSKKYGSQKDKLKFTSFETNLTEANNASIEIGEQSFFLIGDAYRQPNYQLGHGLNNALQQARWIGTVFSKFRSLRDYNEECCSLSSRYTDATRFFSTKDKPFIAKLLNEEVTEIIAKVKKK